MADKLRLKAEVREGVLYLDGVKQDLQIEQHKSLQIRVAGIRRFNGFSFYKEDGPPSRTRQLRGTGTIEDSLEVLGVESRSRKLSVSFQPSPETEDSRFVWQAHLGWMASDWELSIHEGWYVQCYLPLDAFEELEREHIAGHIKAFSFGVKAEMWAPWSPMPHVDNTRWHLPPDTFNTGAHVIGRVDGLGWSDGVMPRDEHDEAIPSAETADDRDDGQPAESPLATIMKTGAEANAKIAQILGWGMPAVVALLAVIAYHGR